MKAYVTASTEKALVHFENGTEEAAAAKAEYTKNGAKYRVILLAIHVAKSRNINLTEVVSDSQSVVKQLNGVSKVKSPALRILAEAIWRKTGAVYADGILTVKGDVVFTYAKQ